MKYSININQKELIKLAPDAGLVDGAILDFIHGFCASVSEDIEAMRITGPDGRRYTWLDYSYLIGEMPLLKGRARSTLTPVIKRLEEWGFIKTYSPDHRRKFVAQTAKMDQLYTDGDKKREPFRKQNSAVRKTKQLGAYNCSENRTYKGIRDKRITYPEGRPGVDKSTFRSGTGMESMASIMKKRI